MHHLRLDTLASWDLYFMHRERILNLLRNGVDIIYHFCAYHMYLSCLFRLLLSVTVSRTFLVFDDLDSFENIGQVFCRMAFLWNLADVFLIPGLEL